MDGRTTEIHNQMEKQKRSQKSTGCSNSGGTLQEARGISDNFFEIIQLRRTRLAAAWLHCTNPVRGQITTHRPPTVIILSDSSTQKIPRVGDYETKFVTRQQEPNGTRHRKCSDRSTSRLAFGNKACSERQNFSTSKF